MRTLCLLWLLSLSFLTAAQDRSTTVYLYTYHNKPPFVVDLANDSGLYFDLADALSRRSDKYSFVTVYLPRKRLDHIIEDDRLDGIVLGAHPVWFGDSEQTRFLWSAPYYADRDEYISLKTAPFEYTADTPLTGKTVAAVAGYYYHGVNEGVKKGTLKRIDTVGEEQVLRLIKLKRAEVGLVSQSVYSYLKKHQIIDDIYHLSHIPHDEFQRRAFTSGSYEDAFAAFSLHLASMIQDGEWKRLVDAYR